MTKNSVSTLSNLISNIDGSYSTSTFAGSIRKFLRYHPVNEFEFFFESIGIDYSEVNRFLPANKFFFSEDDNVFDAACALSGFGLPWNRLGRLYMEEASIFSKSSKELRSKLGMIKSCFGFDNVIVAAICLAFPCVLVRSWELGGEYGALLSDLKMVFVDFDLLSSVDGNVDALYHVCRKIRVFYDLGCRKGELGEILGCNRSVLVDYTEEDLIGKVENFRKFGIRNEEICMLLLHCPEILSFDLDSTEFLVEEFLFRFGLSEDELKSLAKKYPYALGKIRMANLPHVIRAVNLQEWFFNMIRNGNHHLLGDYSLTEHAPKSDNKYQRSLEKHLSAKLRLHTLNKLEFLHEIGYGENSVTIKVLANLHGTGSELRERFNCLIQHGLEFSKVSKMISMAPKVLNQSPDTIDQKVKYLCEEMGDSIDLLYRFPTFLCFDLEKRIKPRYRFHIWLNEKGLTSKIYSIASIVATSERAFLSRIYKIHPTAPKHWLELFKNGR